MKQDGHISCPPIQRTARAGHTRAGHECDERGQKGTMELVGALSRTCSLCQMELVCRSPGCSSGCGTRMGRRTYINQLCPIMQHIEKLTASKVGHRTERGSGEALPLEKGDGDERRIIAVSQCMRWDKGGSNPHCLVLWSTRGGGLSTSPTVVQESHAYYQLLEKAGKICEGTKQAIRAEGLITETQKYPFGKPAWFVANPFQQPIWSYHTRMLLYVS